MPAAAQKKALVTATAKALTETNLGRHVSPLELVSRTRAFMRTHQGNLPKRTLSQKGNPISIHTMKEDQKYEVRLARKVYYHLTQCPAPQDPFWQELDQLYNSDTDIEPIPEPDEFLAILQDWVQHHNGYRPRLNIYRNGKQLTADELKREPLLYEEHTLARRLYYLLRQGVADKTIRNGLATIEQLPTVTRWENPKENQFYDGFGNALPLQYEFAAQLQAWVDAHGGQRPRNLFYGEGHKYRPTAQLTPSEYEEYTLANHLLLVLRKGNLDREVRRQLEHINTLPVWHPERENR